MPIPHNNRSGTISGGFKERMPVLLPLQTTFVLGGFPADASKSTVIVNGIEYHNPSNFTVAANVVTWLNLFTLSPTDEVYFHYL